MDWSKAVPVESKVDWSQAVPINEKSPKITAFAQKEFDFGAGPVGDTIKDKIGTLGDTASSLATISDFISSPVSAAWSYLMGAGEAIKGKSNEEIAKAIRTSREFTSLKSKLHEMGVEEAAVPNIVDKALEYAMWPVTKGAEIAYGDKDSIQKIIFEDLGALGIFGGAAKVGAKYGKKEIIPSKPIKEPNIKIPEKDLDFSKATPVDKVDFDPTIPNKPTMGDQMEFLQRELPFKEEVGIDSMAAKGEMDTFLLDRSRLEAEKQISLPFDTVEVALQNNPSMTRFLDEQQRPIDEQFQRQQPTLFDAQPNMTPELKDVSGEAYPKDMPGFPAAKEWLAEERGDPSWRTLNEQKEVVEPNKYEPYWPDTSARQKLETAIDRANGLQDKPLGQIKSSQSGSIDPKVFIEGFKKIAKFAGEVVKHPMQYSTIPENVKAELSKVLPQYKDFGQALVDHISNDKAIADVNLIAGGDVPNLMKNKQYNPILTQWYWTMDKVFGEGNKTFLDTVQTKLEDVYLNLKNKEKINIAKVMTLVNSHKYQQYLKANNLTEAPDTLLTQLGASPADISVIKAIRPIMQVLKQLDDYSATLLRGKTFTSDVIDYWPISRGGQYMIMLRDAADNSKPIWLRGASTWREYKHYKKLIEEDVRKLNAKGNRIEIEEILPTEREHGLFDEFFLNTILQDTLTDSATGLPKNPILKELGIRQIEAGEKYKRTFEKARLHQDMGGTVGTWDRPNNLLDKILGHKDEDTVLMETFHRRIFNSYKFYLNARLVSEVMKPLLNPQVTQYMQDKAPNAYKVMLLNTMRSLGHDLTKGTAEEWVNKGLNTLHRHAEGLGETDLQLNNRNTVKSGIKFLNSFGVFNVLFAKPLFLMQQTIPLITLIPHSFREASARGINNPARVSLASTAAQVQLLTLTELMGMRDFNIVPKKIIEQRLGDYPRFMKKMVEEGHVAAHLYDDLLPSLARDHDFAESKVKAALAVTRQQTVDRIEQAGNGIALTYYYYFVENLFGKTLSREQKDLLALDWAKSHTAKYTAFNRPLMYDRLGAVGEVGKPFATWTHTQMSKIGEDIRHVGKGNPLPLAYNLVAWSLLGGFVGLPGVVDYEVIRRFYNQYLAEEDDALPPADLMAAELGIPEELRKPYLADALTAGTVDLASSQRYSSFLELRMLGLTTGLNMYKLAKNIADIADEAIGKTEPEETIGPTLKQKREMITAAPAVIQPMLADKYAKSGNKILNKYGNPMFSQETETEEFLNKIGIKTPRQRDQQASEQAFRYALKDTESKIKALSVAIKDAILLDNPEAAKENFRRYVNMNGVDAASRLIDQIDEEVINRSLMPSDKAKIDLSKTSSQGKMLAITRGLRAQLKLKE